MYKEILFTFRIHKINKEYKWLKSSTHNVKKISILTSFISVKREAWWVTCVFRRISCIFSFLILNIDSCLWTPRPQLQGVVAHHPIPWHIFWCWLTIRDFTKIWWNYPTPHFCLQTMVIVWTDNLGRSLVHQIDGIILLPK